MSGFLISIAGAAAIVLASALAHWAAGYRLERRRLGILGAYWRLALRRFESNASFRARLIERISSPTAMYTGGHGSPKEPSSYLRKAFLAVLKLREDKT